MIGITTLKGMSFEGDWSENNGDAITNARSRLINYNGWGDGTAMYGTGKGNGVGGGDTHCVHTYYNHGGHVCKVIGYDYIPLLMAGVYR